MRETYIRVARIRMAILTVSDPAAVTNSCKARTDSACSMTNTHCDRSGGTFLSAMFSRKQCRLPNPSAAKQTRSPVAVQESVTMSSYNGIRNSMALNGVRNCISYFYNLYGKNSINKKKMLLILSVW